MRDAINDRTKKCVGVRSLLSEVRGNSARARRGESVTYHTLLLLRTSKQTSHVGDIIEAGLG